MKWSGRVDLNHLRASLTGFRTRKNPPQIHNHSQPVTRDWSRQPLCGRPSDSHLRNVQAALEFATLRLTIAATALTMECDGLLSRLNCRKNTGDFLPAPLLPIVTVFDGL